MALQIILNQVGAPAGVAGQAREDLVTGVPVVASLSGGPFANYFWTLGDKPVQYLGAPSLSSAACQTPLAASTSISPLDNPGTYLLRVLVDSGQGLGATPDDVATITFYAGPSLNPLPNALPRRKPAFGERLEHNVLDALFAMFGGLNIRGWAQEMDRWFEVIKAMYLGQYQAWARVQLNGGGATIVMSKNVATVTRTGVGTVDVTFINPMTSANFGINGSARGLVGGSICGYNEALGGCTIARANPFGMLSDNDFFFGVVST